MREDATIGQRLLWALDRQRGESGALNCPALCSIRGPLDVDELRRAVTRLVERHPALRTGLSRTLPLSQTVMPPSDVPVTVRDLRAGGAEAVDAYVRRELATRIDPTRSPLRVSLLRESDERHLLVLNAHHVATDLWSSRVIVEDFASLMNGREVRPPDPDHEWDYLTFSRWQRERFASGALASRHRYWGERLAGMRPLPTPLADAPRRDRCGSTGLLERTLSRSVRNRLEAIARDRSTSSFAVLLAVLLVLAYRRSGETDLAVASLIANRSRPELRRTVGFLVDLFMVRVRVRGRPSFLDFVEQARKAIVGALANAEVPYHAVTPRPPRLGSRGHARPDDFVFHAYPEPLERGYRADDLRLRLEVPEVVGRFDLELAVRPIGDALLARLTYNEQRVALTAANEMLRGYVETARSVARSPDRSIGPSFA